MINATIPTKPPTIRSQQELDDYKNFLRVLEWKVSNIPVVTAADQPSTTATIVELHQMAILVYLDRVSGELLGDYARTQQLTDKSFDIFSRLPICERQFPVFILGCEARTDEQRAIVLDLISRTEKNVSSRSFLYVRILLQAIWAQDELANGALHYWDKLSSIMSCCAIVPIFA
jgi:hypothetical protein